MKYPNEVAALAQLHVYPNPTEDLLTVIGLDANAVYKVFVQNSLGMTVLSDVQVSSNLLGELQMSVGGLPAGMYCICVKGDSDLRMVKFVKR